MSQKHLTPRLTLIILFFLIVIPAASGQTPCPASSSTSYDRQYHNVGEVLVMPINLLPCQTVEVYESHDFNNNLNKGTVLVYSYYNEAGQELYTEFQNAFGTGGKAFPHQGSRFEALPWRGSIGPEGLPVRLEVSSFQVIGGDPEYSFVVTKKPRQNYNLGGRSVNSALAVSSLPSTFYGSLREIEQGQFFKVHLEGNQSLYVSGYADVPEPVYGAVYAIEAYDSSGEKVQDLVNQAVSGAVAYESVPFTNPHTSPADFYIRVTSTTFNVTDFKMTLAVQPISHEEPLIFIPGISGSYLVDKTTNADLWPGFGTNHNSLTLDPAKHPNPNIIATDAIRHYTVTIPYPGGSIVRDTVIYEPLLEALTTRGNYREYQVNNDDRRRTTAGCDTYQRSNDPNLFVFAYDWRQSNIANANSLADYVGCVQKFHPGVKINILAHSQGGLVARRYILVNPGKIHELISINSPWLGAPKAIYALETGDAGFSPFLVWNRTLRSLMEFFEGTHELLPSHKYFFLGGLPFREVGDFNRNGEPNETYTDEQLTTLLNNRHPGSPATTGHNFHDYPGQDDWRNDQTGVDYHIILGEQHHNNTIGQVIAQIKAWCLPTSTLTCLPYESFSWIPINGDGTVPKRSAERIANGIDLAPTATRWHFHSYTDANDEFVEHTGLTKFSLAHDRILHLLGRGPDPGAEQIADQPKDPSYYLTASGIDFVSVADAFGNSNLRVDDTFALPVPGVTYDVLGEKSIAMSMTTNQTYTLEFQKGSNPVALELVKGIDKTTLTEAVRYQDIDLPEGVTARIETTSQGIGELRYDGDSDGIFETVVPPTAILSGAAAQDIDPPTVVVDSTKQETSYTVTITAQDTGSGVKTLFYSLDGVSFHPYAEPLSIGPNEATSVYAFADDHAANRSSLVTYKLPTKSALLVTNSVTLNSSDRFVKTRLQELAYQVTTKDAASSLSADANGKNLVVISSTVTPEDVGSKFRNSSVGLVTWESELFDDLGMTGSVAGTDFGSQQDQTDGSIPATSNPLAGGLSGTITLANSSTAFNWAKPNANAGKIATLTNDAEKVLLFGYESGISMPGLVAPGRRVGLFMGDDTADNLTSDGWSLFDAAVNWASGETNNAPAVNITSPANNTIFNANSNISITAEANDTDGVITKVDFYADQTLLASVTTSPYSFTWTNASLGTHALTAIATDDNAATTTSTSVTVTVSESNGAIAGKITQSNGTTPIMGAIVDLYSGTTLITTTTTDSAGDYAISGLDPGTRDVKASAEDYQEQTESGVTIVNGTTTTVDFSLNSTQPTNLALNKSTVQSSTAWGGVASRAVDGNTSGNWNDNSVTHTAVENQPWWQLDLGNIQAIQTVQLWNRTDCCGDVLTDFYVFVSDDPFESTDIEATQSQSNVTTYHVSGTVGVYTSIAVQRLGRYLRVQLGRNERLSLAEVQVWGGSLTPPPTPINLALNRSTLQSNTLWGGYASRAVDGNTNANWSQNSVTHTAVQNQPWWQVDLGSIQSIETVKLWNRTDCCGEALSNVYVFVSDEPFVSTDLTETQNQTGMWSNYTSGQLGAQTTVTVGRTGRYVRLQLAGNDRLSLAEVQVWAAP